MFIGTHFSRSNTFGVSEFYIYGDKIVSKQKARLPGDDVPACIMRDCLSESLFSHRKNSHRARGSSTAAAAELPWISIYVRISAPHMRQWHERFGTSLGKLARDKTSVLTTKLRLFCLVSLSLLPPRSSAPVLPSFRPSLFPIYWIRELPDSRNANLTCTRRRTRQEERGDWRVWTP